MSKASWNTISPMSGSGNGIVNVGGSVHTGRIARMSQVAFKAVGVTDRTLAVIQKAKAEFVAINNVSAPAEGGNVTVTGRSNSSKLTFSLGAGDITITLPGEYSAGGATTANGAAIAGDPGGSAEFEFSFTVSVPENGSITPRTKSVNVVAEGGQSASSTISQPAGEPELTIEPESVTIESDGTAVAVAVTSNTNWTAE